MNSTAVSRGVGFQLHWSAGRFTRVADPADCEEELGSERYARFMARVPAPRVRYAGVETKRQA